MTQGNNSQPSNDTRRLLGLALGALGVVYGDIGTSPLYAIRECFFGSHSVKPTPLNVLGVMSLIFWSLIIVISIKYLVFVMRADNRGEGGILALMALIRARKSGRWALVAMGLFGAALLYGDGMITPAISVLSAVEGLEVATSLFKPYVQPITIAILIVLFVIQRRGTEKIGALFGPVMVVWFVVLGLLGLPWILREPRVLAAINPVHAVRLFSHDGLQGFLVLGSVFLVATGGEALYADMGHFGRRPIRFAWFTLVLPALLLNYFGQSALLLSNPGVEHPFYNLAPGWALYPLVVLSTVATVIASQAVISGAYSLTLQAMQLGYCPRMEIVYTSEKEKGQIYIPAINWILMIATIGLVLGFQESSRLAAAYGMAVTTTMVITTLLAYVLAREQWRWSLPRAILVMSSFLVLDLGFFGANLVKVPHGGWFPLLVAALVYLLLSTWKQGRNLLAQILQEGALPLEEFIRSAVRPGSPTRVPGTAVFLTTNPAGTPTTLLHNLKHNKVLHEQVVLMTVVTEDVPRLSAADRVVVEPLDKGFYRLTARYGFVQSPDAQDVLDCAKEDKLDLDLMKTTFFLGRETLIPGSHAGMSLWRKKLFAVMARNSQRFTDFFQIPINRVVELGMQVRL